MNMTTIKNETANHLFALKRSGSEGRRIANQFEMYRNRLEHDARQEFELSEYAIEMAFCDILNVCLAEVTIGTDAEMNDYESFWCDMCAYCKLNYNTDDEEEMCVTENNTTMDEVLSAEQKQDVYKMCAKVASGKLARYCVTSFDIEDIASGMYNRLLSKRVGDVFPHGVPTSEAEWMAFLHKDAEFAWMNYYKKAWRHKAFSLDDTIEGKGHEDDGEGLRMVDAINIDEDSFWQPNRKDDFLASLESQHELQYVHEVFDRLVEGYSLRTRKALKRLVLDRVDIKTVSVESGMTANALYVTKKRLMDAFRQKGKALLARLEMSAA